MKKCVFISCFNAYNDRLKPIELFLTERGFECEYITSDFDHIKKSKFTSERRNTIQLKAIPYYNNFSVNRLLSHYKFAKKAIAEVEKIKPNLLYVMLPPNSLAHFTKKYKRRNKDVKVVYDIYDLWPETFPSPNYAKLLSIPFNIWRGLRDKNLSVADYVITECNLFQDILGIQLTGIKTKTVYPTKLDNRINSKPVLKEGEIHLCYLGSINHIIDIEKITKLIEIINQKKPTTVHIIGDGENKEKLINEIESTGTTVKYYGKIYDQKKKQQVFDKCHFGLNIMKSSVCVGFTLKSLDYFHGSLPILNNIKADTTQIVDKYQLGFNINEDNIQDVASKVVELSNIELLEMRNYTQEAFEDLCSSKTNSKKLKELFSELNLI